MAFTKTVTTQHNLTISDAYHRVEGLYLHGKQKIVFCVRVYADPNAAFLVSEDHECDYSLDGANPLAQAYAYLKTLPQYSDAQEA